MKKLLAVIAILAMAVSYLPAAEAGDSATLGLKVTFDIPDEPLEIWSDPEGPFKAIEGKELTFNVIAEDKDTENIMLWAEKLPPGAKFPDVWPRDLRNRRKGAFYWTPDVGQNQDHPYLAVFEAENSQGETVKLEVSISVAEAVLSIELTPTTWIMEGVKLGEKRRNVDSNGGTIHKISNTGNVNASVMIRYFPMKVQGTIRPGPKQGQDMYVTGVNTLNGEQTLIPGGELFIGVIEAVPDAVLPLALTYGAPTGISAPAGISAPISMQGGYELRAYRHITIAQQYDK